jgi:putative ABC transport system substrate-binding protein
VNRRAFIAAVGGAVALPFAVRAQQAMPVVGFLRSSSLADSAHLLAAFRLGLKEAGFVEGQNVAIEHRYADNMLDRLPALVVDLIRRPVAVIAGDNLAMTPAKAATDTVPIVFAIGGDPVRQGLVASLNRPGGNVTGVVFLAGALGTKRLELLRQVLPKATTIAVLVNPINPTSEAEHTDIRAAAQAIGQRLLLLEVSSQNDIENAFATLAQRGAGALLVGSGAFLNSNRDRIVALATRQALPSMYAQREPALSGGLMSYGPSIADSYRQAGAYTGRILKGEKPADLPVMQSSKFEFVLNLKTAKTLGLEIAPTVLALADEVIE